MISNPRSDQYSTGKINQTLIDSVFLHKTHTYTHTHTQTGDSYTHFEDLL